MDLDGTWLDENNNGIFDKHKGNVAPEIFISRFVISSSLYDINLLTSYFDKNHQYWIGKIAMLERKGLSYINYGWGLWYKIKGMQYLYGEDNYDFYRYNSDNFGETDYLNKLKSGQYEFVQLASHSNPTTHLFPQDTLRPFEIQRDSLLAIGYNLFCCSACCWFYHYNNQLIKYSANQFMGGAYIFNKGNGLSVVGSTKTGSMLNFKYFYKPLGQGKTMGQSLLEWWQTYVGNYHTAYEIHWFYGLTIIGDPFIMMKYNTNTNCRNVLTLTHFDANITSDLHYYRANQRIEVGGNYVIPAGNHVILDAPEIVLSPGFVCQEGATFETRSEGCACNHTTTKHNIAQRDWDMADITEEDEENDGSILLTDEIRIYPNPADKQITIVVQEDIVSARIFDVSGQCVLQCFSIEIDVSRLSAGIYVIHCTTASGKVYQRTFIKL